MQARGFKQATVLGRRKVVMSLVAKRLLPSAVGAGTERLVIAASLLSLWILGLFSESLLGPRLLVVSIGFIVAWNMLSRSLSPFVLELRPTSTTLHSLVAIGAVLLSVLCLVLYWLGRLPPHLTTATGTPILFLDCALLGVLCQSARNVSEPRRPVPSAMAYLVVAVGGAVIWLGIGASPDVACRAFFAVLLVSDPLLIGQTVRKARAAVVKSLDNRGLRLATPDLLPRLGQVDLVLFQRSGILTCGRPHVSHVGSLAGDRDPDDILRLVAAAEFGVHHPLSEGILGCEGVSNGTIPNVRGFEHFPARGVRAYLQGRELLCGNLEFLQDQGWPQDEIVELRERSRELRERGDTVVYLSVQGEVTGMIAFDDSLRPEAIPALNRLRELGVRAGVLSGDDRVSVEGFSRHLGQLAVFANLGPKDTQSCVEGQLAAGSTVALVAPQSSSAAALDCATVGIEWPERGTGSDRPATPNRITLETPDLSRVPNLLEIARKFRRRTRALTARVLAYQALVCLLVAGALFPSLGWGPNPVLAAGAFLLVKWVTSGESTHRKE